MSIYSPKPETLKVVEMAAGYYEVHDAYGYWDGPYTKADAYSVVRAAQSEIYEEKERKRRMR